MENVDEFKAWFYQMLSDAEKKLKMEDSTLADILIREGLNYYLRSRVKGGETPPGQRRGE